MRKTLILLSAISTIALATPASAERYHRDSRGTVAAGAVAGTVVGLGLYNGWFGSGALATALPMSAAGAAVTGGVAGIGTIAVIDAATQPCAGFRALFSPFASGPSRCVNGQYVGYRVSERQTRRHYR